MPKSMENPDVYAKRHASVLLTHFDLLLMDSPPIILECKYMKTPGQNMYELAKHWLFSVPGFLCSMTSHVLLTCTIFSNFPV